MLKLKDVYALPTTPTPLTDYILSHKLLPDVDALEYHVPHQTLMEMDAEGLLQVRCVAYENFDGERSAGLYTLWFKDQPVGIFNTAGRGGDEYVERWITNVEAYALMCQYLRAKLTEQDVQTDFHDPERVIYPEEIFCVYGQDFGARFGHPAEKTAKGIMLFLDKLVPGVDHKLRLVTAESKYDPMPEYIRRFEHVFKRVRALSKEELALNPRLVPVSAEEGHTQFYWYEPSERPEDAKVLAI